MIGILKFIGSTFKGFIPMLMFFGGSPIDANYLDAPYTTSLIGFTLHWATVAYYVL